MIIVGAGLAGLSAARELKHLDRSFLILEANNRIGGRGYVGLIDYTGLKRPPAWSAATFDMQEQNNAYKISPGSDTKDS